MDSLLFFFLISLSLFFISSLLLRRYCSIICFEKKSHKLWDAGIRGGDWFVLFCFSENWKLPSDWRRVHLSGKFFFSITYFIFSSMNHSILYTFKCISIKYGSRGLVLRWWWWCFRAVSTIDCGCFSAIINYLLRLALVKTPSRRTHSKKWWLAQLNAPFSARGDYLKPVVSILLSFENPDLLANQGTTVTCLLGIDACLFYTR